jgi:hypothetical protein
MVVVEVEHEANSLLGAYNKEHMAFPDCCSHGSCVNRCFYEMGVGYEARKTPSELLKRGRVSGNMGSKEPVAKKGKKEAVLVVGGPSGQIASGRPPRRPAAKLSSNQEEIQKKKGTVASKYPFKIAECDMGSPTFMKALKATECSVPWSLGSRGRPIEIDIEQFGSLHAGPRSIGVMILDLHQMPSVPTRMVNLVDD